MPRQHTCHVSIVTSMTAYGSNFISEKKILNNQSPVTSLLVSII